jgi:hypothetical protein
MLSAAFLPEGPVRNGLSALAGILGALTLIKFFTQWIGPNEGAYRTRNQQMILCYGIWKLTRYGVMHITTEPHYRTYGKGFQFKTPFVYDLQVVSVAEVTREIPSFTVDSEEDIQFAVATSVTYQTILDASCMFRAVERSLTLDAAIVAAASEAVGIIFRGNPDTELIGSGELTKKVRKLTKKTLRPYGIRLVRINTSQFSKSLAEKLKGQPVRLAGIVNSHGEITHPHEIPA